MQASFLDDLPSLPGDIDYNQSNSEFAQAALDHIGENLSTTETVRRSLLFLRRWGWARHYFAKRKIKAQLMMGSIPKVITAAGVVDSLRPPSTKISDGLGIISNFILTSDLGLQIYPHLTLESNVRGVGSIDRFFYHENSDLNEHTQLLIERELASWEGY